MNCHLGHPWCNLHPKPLSVEDLDAALLTMQAPSLPQKPTLIVSPSVKEQIDASPVLQEAVRIVLGST